MVHSRFIWLLEIEELGVNHLIEQLIIRQGKCIGGSFVIGKFAVEYFTLFAKYLLSDKQILLSR